MSEAAPGPVLDDGPGGLGLLASWMATRRWYSGVGEPHLSLAGGFTLDDPAGEAILHVLLVADDSPGARGDAGATAPAGPVIYQVPLSFRAAEDERLAGARIGTVLLPGHGRRVMYDGPGDPAFAAQLFELAVGRAGARPLPPATPGGQPGGPAYSGPAPGPGPGPIPAKVTGSRVLSGEQSNTSIILTLGPLDDAPASGRQDWPPEAIIKVFRAPSPGENPDVVLTSAIWAAQAGRDEPAPVPRPLGYVTGTCAPGSDEAGHLALVQEFLPGTADAWRTACAAAAAGQDFTARARELGRATAAVHQVLAREFPAPEATAAGRGELLRQWRGRAADALAAVPALAVHREAIEAVFTAAAAAPWPRLQRVHGDLHLGQVLDVPGRGWVLLDFEGEPLRPLAERTRPDLAMRDVAGIVRSFDYVAGTVPDAAPEPGAAERARAWADAATKAFLEGYRQAAGDAGEQHDPVLAALLLDKALYEVSYETRNRPDWARLPVSAVTRLLSR